jgi:hypothetical protein
VSGLCLLLASLIALSLTALSAAAQAAAFRRIAPSVVAFASDGTRYAAWQVTESSPIVVLDSRTGKRKSYAGCSLVNEEEEQGPVAGAVRFAVHCGEDEELLDAKTGTKTLLPAPNIGTWSLAGERYVEAFANTDVVSPDPQDCGLSAKEVRMEAACIGLYDIATGAVSYRRPSQPPDINRPGAPPICRALRGKLLGAEARLSARRFAYHEGVLAEAVQHGEAPIKRIRLTSCRGHTKLIATAPEPANLIIADGLLSWDTGHQALVDHEGENIRSGRLWTYRLASGRRRSLPLPLLDTLSVTEKIRGVLGYSSHAGATLFWIAATRLVQEGKGEPTLAASAVYAASYRRPVRVRRAPPS